MIYGRVRLLFCIGFPEPSGDNIKASHLFYVLGKFDFNFFNIMVIGIIALILGVILFFKVWGMCNNVKDIKRAICSQQYEKMKEKEKDIVKSNTPESSPFSIGQLVIVKSNESQFRINSISRRGDSFIYYSEKYNKDFSADEIEDFDEYWKTKGNK